MSKFNIVIVIIIIIIVRYLYLETREPNPTQAVAQLQQRRDAATRTFMQLFGRWENASGGQVVFTIEDGTFMIGRASGHARLLPVLDIMRINNHFVALMGDQSSLIIPILNSSTIIIDGTRYTRVGNAVTPFMANFTDGVVQKEFGLNDSVHSILGGVGWAIGATLL